MTIKYSEHGFTIIVKSYTPIGTKLIGMREGKPFLRKNKLMINMNGKLCEITRATFVDKEGNNIAMNEAPLDIDERISGVLVRGKSVLLLHRIKKDREYFVFPGGHRIRGESDLEALKREMQEELNIEIAAGAKLLLELDKEGFGREKYYRIEVKSSLDNMYKENQDRSGKETNKPIFLDLKEAKDMDNVFPAEVIKLLLNE